MSSLNEKGRKLLTRKLNSLSSGFIYNYMSYSRESNSNEIPSKIIETCIDYTDPFTVWIATRVFVRFSSSNIGNDSTNTNNEELNYKISLDCKSITIINKEINIKGNNCNENLQFEYDYIYNTQSTSNDMFERTGKPLIDMLLNGYNTSLISYGHNESGSHSILFGEYTYDPFDRNRKRNKTIQTPHNMSTNDTNDANDECIISDHGLYQQCLQYLFCELKSKQLNDKRLLNYEIKLQHIYTYPDMELLEDALLDKYTQNDTKSKRRSTDRNTEMRKPLKIKNRKRFNDRNDTQIYIENARSMTVLDYEDSKRLYQMAHNNIFSSQLKYARIERSEAKSNYLEYKNSINQIISIDLTQYFNNGTLYESNLKFIIPKYYFGKNNMYENVLSKSNSLPLSNYHKSDGVILRTKSDNTSIKKNGQTSITSYKQSILPSSDPLFSVCSALSKDLMPKYKYHYFTHLCKNVLGGNCKTLFLINCSLDSKYTMETIKCLQFGGKVLRLIHNNPKLNIQSIKQWTKAYNELRNKYDKLFDEINKNNGDNNNKYQTSQQSKLVTNSVTNSATNVSDDYKKEEKVKDNDVKLTEYRNDKKVIKQGYLNKEGGVIKSIKVRYFVLFENRQLHYFDDILSNQSIGIIDIKHDCKNIEQINWLKEEDSHNFYGFILTTKKRKWKLGTGSINEVNKWIKALKKASGKKYY